MKQKKTVALMHEKVRHSRLDYCHQLTHWLVNDNQVTTYVVEDLNPKGMTKNRKLSRAILDVGIGHFEITPDVPARTVICLHRFGHTVPKAVSALIATMKEVVATRF